MIFGTEVIICGISKHPLWYIGNISHWIICRKSILHVIDIAMIQCFSSYGIYCSWFSNMIYFYENTFEISMYSWKKMPVILQSAYLILVILNSWLQIMITTRNNKFHADEWLLEHRLHCLSVKREWIFEA